MIIARNLRHLGKQGEFGEIVTSQALANWIVPHGLRLPMVWRNPTPESVFFSVRVLPEHIL
jgi:hypothetical protein